MLHGLVLGRKPENETVCFAAAGDERYLLCGAVAAAVVPSVIGSSSVFCKAWFLCVCEFYAFLESVVADRIGMAA